MQQDKVNNIHISSERILSTPEMLKSKLAAYPEYLDFVKASREQIADIVHKRDNRLLLITGPCSIHDVEAAKEYALKLKQIREKYLDKFYIVMRVYFEKPRTTVGWKGLINDPHLDGSLDIESGLFKARELLLWLAEQKIPVASEALDPISPQYLMDLVSWVAVGARTTESQTHREMASGLSMPVGFKNGTDGNIAIALNAMKSAAAPHGFIGINQQGQVSVINTSGNPDGHIILRGGKKPNYHSEAIFDCEQQLLQAAIEPSLMVDCSHANSNKDYRRQSEVAQNVADQICAGNKSIIGIMLESNLSQGNQQLAEAPRQLQYGVSITDACIDWSTTESLITSLYNKLEAILAVRFINKTETA